MLTEWSPKREAEVNHRTELAGMARLRMVVGRILKKREKKRRTKTRMTLSGAKQQELCNMENWQGGFIRRSGTRGQKGRKCVGSANREDDDALLRCVHCRDGNLGWEDWVGHGREAARRVLGQGRRVQTLTSAMDVYSPSLALLRLSQSASQPINTCRVESHSEQRRMKLLLN